MAVYCGTSGFIVSPSPSREVNIGARLGSLAGPTCTRTETNYMIVAEQETYDIVVSMEVLEHVPDPAALIADLVALAKPGGALLLSTLNRTPKALALADPITGIQANINIAWNISIITRVALLPILSERTPATMRPAALPTAIMATTQNAASPMLFLAIPATLPIIIRPAPAPTK